LVFLHLHQATVQFPDSFATGFFPGIFSIIILYTENAFRPKTAASKILFFRQILTEDDARPKFSPIFS
jgi:hypothetical protein